LLTHQPEKNERYPKCLAQGYGEREREAPFGVSMQNQPLDIMIPVYEDNHIIIVSKHSGEIVQRDKTGDVPLVDIVKNYLKEKYAKPGNVFLGVVHRLDRPVWGLVAFAKTSKALSRMNALFRTGDVEKTYWAIVQSPPENESGELVHWLTRNEKQNKSYAHNHEVAGAKKRAGETMPFLLPKE